MYYIFGLNASFGAMFLSPSLPVAGRQQFRCGNHWPGAEAVAGDGDAIWTIFSIFLRDACCAFSHHKLCAFNSLWMVRGSRGRIMARGWGRGRAVAQYFGCYQIQLPKAGNAYAASPVIKLGLTATVSA